MKNRKPTLAQQKATADTLLLNEAKNRKLFLSVAKAKCEELKAELKELQFKDVPKKDVKKLQKRLEEQTSVLESHNAWLKEHNIVNPR